LQSQILVSSHFGSDQNGTERVGNGNGSTVATLGSLKGCTVTTGTNKKGCKGCSMYTAEALVGRSERQRRSEASYQKEPTERQTMDDKRVGEQIVEWWWWWRHRGRTNKKRETTREPCIHGRRTDHQTGPAILTRDGKNRHKKVLTEHRLLTLTHSLTWGKKTLSSQKHSRERINV
jgi:hypothetical protein